MSKMLEMSKQVWLGKIGHYVNVIIGHLTGKWLEILIKPFCQKLECRKTPFCKIQGMSNVSKKHAAYSRKVHTAVFVIVVEDFKDGTNHNTLCKVTVYIVCHVQGVEDSVHIHE